MGDHQATALAVPVAHLRLAVLRRYFCDLLDDEVRARFEESLERIRGAGATIVDIDLAGTDYIAPVYLTIGCADAAAFHTPTLDEVPERYTVGVRLRLEAGRYLLAEDYSRALRGQEVLREAVDRALSSYDALVLPSLPIPAPVLGAQSLSLGGRTESVRSLMIRETQLFNLTGHPAIPFRAGPRRSACLAACNSPAGDARPRR